VPVCSIETHEYNEFDVLLIDADLFTWETPLESTLMEFKCLSSMESNPFTYNLLMSYTEDELLLLWSMIESKGLVWTTIKEDEGRFRIEYMNQANYMKPSHDKKLSKEQTTKPSYMPYDDRLYGLDKSKLEDEMMYAAQILIKNKLVRLMDISLTDWLGLKYGDPELAPMNEVKRIITSWLSRSFKEQVDEFVEIKKRMVSDTSFDVNNDPNDNDFYD
jgi:hypothetical protein